MRWMLLLAALALAGCLGSDKTFPDESDQVAQLKLNAYEATSGPAPREALLELHALGADGQERAFKGHVSAQLSNGTGLLKSWEVDVSPTDFASTTVAMFVIHADGSLFPGDGTYNATATALVAGRSYNASAAFAYSASPSSTTHAT